MIVHLKMNGVKKLNRKMEQKKNLKDQLMTVLQVQIGP